MFDANNTSSRSYGRHRALTPAGWLQQFIRKQKYHAVFLSLKSAEK